MSIDKMLEWLRKTEIPLTTISKKTNISRKTLYNWINGGEVRKRSYLKVYNIYKHDIELINTNIQLKEGHTMEAQYIIDLQKEKIERLENELHQHRNSPFESTEWSNIAYEMYSEVLLTFNFPHVVGRTMTVLTGRKYITEYLGYNEEEIDKYWKIGKYYKKFSDHPVNKILTKSSVESVNHRVKTMPTLFESLKNMMGDHQIPLPISFICKNGEIMHTVTYNKVDWKNKIVKTKTKFLLDD